MKKFIILFAVPFLVFTAIQDAKAAAPAGFQAWKFTKMKSFSDNLLIKAASLVGLNIRVHLLENADTAFMVITTDGDSDITIEKTNLKTGETTCEAKGLKTVIGRESVDNDNRIKKSGNKLTLRTDEGDVEFVRMKPEEIAELTHKIKTYTRDCSGYAKQN